MIDFLENSKIKITVSDKGAELHSITSKETETEFLWNGDAAYWKYHAPHLFPNIGKLVDMKYVVNGKEYELPSHGIARISEFKMLEKTEDLITYELKYTEETLKIYPYKFAFRVRYTIKDNRIFVNYEVMNLDDKDIFFSIGAHPAFICDEGLSEYYLEFEKKENSSAILANSKGYMITDRREYLANTNILPLSKELFEDGSFMFDDLKSKKIWIKSKNSNKSVCVEFDGFPYLCLWSPENGAPFVCIEPWYGCADFEGFKGEFSEKPGTVKVEVNKSFTAEYGIIIEN